jgi:hypothetical protein
LVKFGGKIFETQIFLATFKLHFIVIFKFWERNFFQIILEGKPEITISTLSVTFSLIISITSQQSRGREMSSTMSQSSSSNYLPHQYSHQQHSHQQQYHQQQYHQQQFHQQQSHSSLIDHVLLFGNESRPPMLLPGTYTVWKRRFLQWLTDRPAADLMLNFIQDGPYKMIILADSTGIMRLQTTADLNATELAQYDADHQAAWSMSLALPNSIYMNMDFQVSAYEMWKYLEALHRTEELHHIRMKQILESCLSMNPLKTILPAPPSPTVDDVSLIYTPNGIIFNPPNAPEPFFIPQYHPATLYNNVQSLLQNLVKLSQVSTEKGKGVMTSSSELLNTMEDTNDEEDLIEPSIAFLAYAENIANVEAQDYDSTPLFDDNFEYNATLSRMEVEGGNLNVVLHSVMGDIPSDDEYADLESNTADLEADTTNVMLMADMQELQLNDSGPYVSSDTIDDDEVEAIRNQGCELVARILSKYSNKKNNRIRSSSNTRNQSVVQGERVAILGRNAQRFVGNGENTADVVNVGNEVKILEDNLGVMESKGTESEVQDDNSRLGNDKDVDCAEIIPFYDSEPNFDKGQMDEEEVIPIYDKEPNFDKEQMVEVQSTVDHIMPANEKQQSEQPNFSNEGEVDQDVVQCLDKRSESESLHDNLMTKTSNQTLESVNILLKKTIAQFHKSFSKLEAHCISLELKLQNESLNSGNNGQSLNEQRKRVDTLVKENELLKGQI